MKFDRTFRSLFVSSWRSIVCSLAGMVLTVALPIPASAQASTAVTLDVPGAAFTVARDINNNGDIVGVFFSGRRHGFLLSNGTYTPIDAPAAWGTRQTLALGINDAGVIVGSYFHLDSDGQVHQHGYVLANGSFSPLADVPGSTDTIPWGINNSNVIVGRYLDQAGNLHGFESVKNTATTVDFPNGTGTALYHINNNGDIVGDYSDSVGNVHGLVRSASGSFSSFDVPGATVQPAGTNGFAINDLGQVGGASAKSKSAALDFTEPQADTHGYVMTAGKFVTVNVPGGINTAVYGLNNSSQAVGQYNTPGGGLHGYAMQLIAGQ